jgi:hypothetical protein
MHFFWISKASVEQHAKLEEMQSGVKTISGTRSHHRFIPVSKRLILMREISIDSFGTVAPVTDIDDCNVSHGKVLHRSHFDGCRVVLERGRREKGGNRPL